MELLKLDFMAERLRAKDFPERSELPAFTRSSFRAVCSAGVNAGRGCAVACRNADSRMAMAAFQPRSNYRRLQRNREDAAFNAAIATFRMYWNFHAGH